MKAYNNLFQQIISRENLLRAYRRARKGKKSRRYVQSYFLELEREIGRLHDELAAKTYVPDSYREFHIYEPKKRKISAPSFRDRIVHHALCNVIEPLFERTFIYDSYANRLGKGTHRAISRCQKYLRMNRYYMKFDIRQYFPSIDHEILKTLLRRKIKDRNVLWLIDSIIDGSNIQDSAIFWFPGDDLLTPLERRRGLPIGSQTSQFFSNVYLNPLDHFVKERLSLSHYVRYVDDFIAFGDDKSVLLDTRKRIIQFLRGLRLRIHENKSLSAPVEGGVDFLGFRIFPDHRLLRKTNAFSFRRRYRKMKQECADGTKPFEKLTESVRAWVAHAAGGDTWGMRKKILWYDTD